MCAVIALKCLKCFFTVDVVAPVQCCIRNSDKTMSQSIEPGEGLDHELWEAYQAIKRVRYSLVDCRLDRWREVVAERSDSRWM